MRSKKNKAFISIDQPKKDKFKVYAVMEIGRGLEPTSYKLSYDGVRFKGRTGGKPGIWCSKFILELQKSTSPIQVPNLCYFESGEFPRDKDENGNDIDHIWVKVKLPVGGQPDDGPVGNYDDPD